LKKTTKVTHEIIFTGKHSNENQRNQLVGWAHTWNDGTICLEFLAGTELNANVVLRPKMDVLEQNKVVGL